MQKIMRIVKVIGKSMVNGGRCKMEKISPCPCTITIPSSKTCTTGTTSESLRVSLIEDDSRSRVLCKGTVLEDVVGVVAQGATSIWTVAGQVGKLATKSAVVANAVILGVTRSMLVAAWAFVVRAVDAKMPQGVALKTVENSV